MEKTSQNLIENLTTAGACFFNFWPKAFTAQEKIFSKNESLCITFFLAKIDGNDDHEKAKKRKNVKNFITE